VLRWDNSDLLSFAIVTVKLRKPNQKVERAPLGYDDVYDLSVKEALALGRARSSSKDADRAARRPCYAVVHARHETCPSCPAVRAAKTRRTCLGIVRFRDGRDGLGLVAARRIDKNTVRVHVYRLDDDVLVDLRKAKIEQLADAAVLTMREREVLELILLGRAPREIAAALNISHSTAKFHQTNTLDKLGAESRFDLLRLLS
jgi:DNA-binding CsgD family transcriptional regulator